MKICSNCKTAKPIEDFRVHKTRGIYARCNDCVRQKEREYHSKNKSKRKVIVKKYKEANKDLISDYHKKWIIKNPLSQSIRQRKYKATGKHKILSKKYRFFLVKSYVRILLKQQLVPITKETILLKTKQLNIYRKIKQIQNEAN